MLTCYMCGETKPEEEFAFADMAKGTRQRHCRKCQAAYRRAHYLRTKATYIANERKRVRGHFERNRVLVLAYLSEHPCVDCGETDPVVLDFDHRDPAEKKDEIARMVRQKTWPVVFREIEKCDVRCAACHRRRTAAQFGWRRALGVELLLERVPIVAVLGRAAQSAKPPPAVDGARACRSCLIVQPLSEFTLKNKSTGCRSTLCRSCQRLYSRRHYLDNRDRYLDKARRHRRRDRDLFAVFVLEYFKDHPCVDCGETDPLVLEFDHRDGSDKLSAVGAFARGQNMQGLLAEIAKCDVRCVNCHRRRTAEQFGWTKLIERSA